jgi:hypothetical protein
MPEGGTGASRLTWRESGVALLAYGLVAIFWTWPLILRVSDSVVGQFGDNMHFAWMIGWFEHALIDLHALPYHVPQLNYPQGWDLARSEIPVTMVIPGLPFAAAGNPILGYNVSVLISFVLTGWATYWWLRDLGASRSAGMLAGLAFAFSPFRIAHFRAGHLNILATMWFPIFLIGLFRALRGWPTPRWLAILSGVAFGLVSLSSQYYFYLTALICLGLSLGYLILLDRERLRSRQLWQTIGWMAAAAIPFVVAGLAPYVRLVGEGGLPQRSVFGVVGGSASLTDFLLPSTDHFLWGAWISQHFTREQWIEGSLYVGAVVAVLAVFGTISLWRKDQRKTVWLLAGLAFLGFIVSIGPYLHWNEQLVAVSLPSGLAQRIGQDSLAVRLPGYYLFKGIPFYDRMRTFKRAAVFVLLPFSALAGLGLDGLRARLRPSSARYIVGLLFVALALDFYPGPFENWSKVEPRPVDRYLAGQPGNGAVAQFPFYLEEDQLHVYYTLYNGKPFLGGFFNAYPPEQYRRIRPVMEGFPDGASLDELKALGVRYVLIDIRAYADPASVDRGLRAHGLVSQGTYGSESVYLVGDS